VHEAGEVERAVGGELEIVGLALGRRYGNFRASTRGVHAVDRLSHYASDQDHAVGADHEAMDPAEGSAGDQPIAFPFGGGGRAREQQDKDGHERANRHGSILGSAG